MAQGIDILAGGAGAGGGLYGSIAGACFGLDGLLYVLDAGNSLVQVLAPSGSTAPPSFVRSFAIGHSGAATDITLDAAGNAYLLVPTAGKVDVYGPAGAYLSALSAAGAAALGASYDRTNTYILSGAAGVNSVSVWGIGGQAKAAITLSQPISGASAVAGGPTGSVYILAATNQIYRFSGSGAFTGKAGAGTSSFPGGTGEYITTLAVDAQENVYCNGSGQNTQVVRFDPPWSETRIHPAKYPNGNNMAAYSAKIALAIEPATGLRWRSASYGVTALPTYLIGLSPTLTTALPYNQQASLAAITFTYAVPAAQFGVHAITVRWKVFDDNHVRVGAGSFAVALTDGAAYSATFSWTPARYGAFTVVCTPESAEVLAGMSGGGAGVVFPGVACTVGAAPAYSNMRALAAGDGGNGLDSPALQAWCGIGCYRASVSSGAAPSSLLSACQAAKSLGQNVVLNFQAASDCTQANVNAAVSALDAYVDAYEFVNEPNFSLSASAETTLRANCRGWLRAAGSTKPCIGPGYVSMAFSRFDSLIAAGGHTSLDAVSTHDYQSNEHVEPGHWDYMIGAFQSRLSAAGKGGLSIWVTERAFTGTNSHVYIPHLQTHRILMHRMIWETHGCPTTRNNYYYVQNEGFASVGSWLFSTTGINPAALALRTRYALLGGLSALATFTSKLDFGASGNDLLLGTLHTAGDGSKVLSLLNMGADSLALTLTITGGGSVTQVDAWGNPSTLTPGAGGILTLSAFYPISYLLLSAGQSFTITPIDYGTNLALSATPTYTGTADQPLTRGNDGLLENLQESDPNPTMLIPHLVNTTDQIVLTWGTAQTLSRVAVFSHEPDNVAGNLLSYDLDYWTGSAWVTLTKARRSCPPTTLAATLAATAIQWTDARCIFLHTFPTISTTKIRLNVRRCTYGLWADDVAMTAGQITITKQFSLRDLRAFAA